MIGSTVFIYIIWCVGALSSYLIKLHFLLNKDPYKDYHRELAAWALGWPVTIWLPHRWFFK